MSLLDPLPFDSISADHLDQLIANRVGEGLDLEYKAAPYGGADADKREFLKDVTALANTAGGHLVIGIKDEGGIAAGLQPITDRVADGEKQRLHNMLLASVEPRLIGIQMREISVEGGYVLLLRVPRSWNPPHRVTHGGWNRYFLRSSSGAYEPSVDQLRAVFLGGSQTERRLTEFRLDRLARLRSGGRGFVLHARGQLVLQTVPLADGAFVVPPVQEVMNRFMPPGASSLSWRHNLEGMLIHSMADHGTGVTTAYTQVFRDGCVEMARGGYVRERPGGSGGRPLVGAGRLVSDIVGGAARMLLGAAHHGAAFPMALMVSFLDAEGTRLAIFSDHFDSEELLDRRDLLFAPVLVEQAAEEADIGRPLLPVLDALWNAYGYPRCDPVRDAEGAWQGVPNGWR